MKAKYIIINKNNIELPFVFSELSTHADVAYALGGKVVGAGFCFVDDDQQYVCYGESISCRVKSREKIDSAILNEMLGMQE